MTYILGGMLIHFREPRETDQNISTKEMNTTPKGVDENLNSSCQSKRMTLTFLSKKKKLSVGNPLTFE